MNKIEKTNRKYRYEVRVTVVEHEETIRDHLDMYDLKPQTLYDVSVWENEEFIDNEYCIIDDLKEVIEDMLDSYIIQESKLDYIDISNE